MVAFKSSSPHKAPKRRGGVPRGEKGRGTLVLMMKDGSAEERVDLTSPSAPVRRQVMGQQSGNHGCGQVTSSSAKAQLQDEDAADV